MTPVPTPAATPVPGAPVVLVLRWPQHGLVIYENGMAKRASDGQPWVIPFETPEHGRVSLVLVTPEMVNKQYARAEAAANKAMDAVAGAYSLLSEVKKRQAALAPTKQKEH